MQYEEIISQFKSLADLDKINIIDHRGFPQLRIGFVVSLFFGQGYTNEKRSAFSKIMRSYYTVFKEHLTHYSDSTTSKVKLIKNTDFLDEYDAKATRVQIKDPDVSEIQKQNPNNFSPNIISMSDDKPNFNPPLYFCGGICLPLDAWFPKDAISYLNAYIPASWVEKNGYDALLELTKTWCQTLQPLHGTVGLAPLFSPYGIDSTSGLLAFSLCKRFIGFDYPSSSKWRSKVVSATNKHVIRTTNWLSIINQSFVDELGGLEKIYSALDSNCPLTTYDNGIILQAGKHAELGDINNGQTLPNYRNVANILKPLLFENYKTGLFDIYEPYDSLTETKKWINRFNT